MMSSRACCTNCLTRSTSTPTRLLAGNEDHLDMAWIHQACNRAERVVVRPDLEPVGTQDQQVSLLAGRERPDLVVERGDNPECERFQGTAD